MYPNWLHVLKRGKEGDNEREDTGWKGRTEEIRKEIHELKYELKEQVIKT